MFKEEERITKEIRESRDGGKKIWECIKKLKGETVKEKGPLRVYDEDGKELEREKAKEEVKKFWSNIYRKHDNDIEETWDARCKEEYIREYDRLKRNIEEKQAVRLNRVQDLEGAERNCLQTCPVEIIEHIDMTRKVEGGFMYLEEECITEERVIKCLNKMKNKRAGGIDKIKAEMYKELGKSTVLKEILILKLKEALEVGQIPDSWKESRTVMIPKIKKPKAKDLRPIALTSAGYKLMMAVIKNSIEDHIVKNRLGQETQAGFTKGSRIENNIFILKYCIENSFKLKAPLIVISVDFEKAYDSIKRGKMIEILMESKVNPKCLDFITKVYTNDKTRVEIGEEEEVEIDVTSGIRQGCTASTSLFKLVTFRIIQELEKLNKGYRDQNFSISSLFFADDGMILANNIEDARHIIRKLMEIGKDVGLEINKGKSHVIIFNMADKPQKIENIEVKDRFKYLGITINDNKDCFKVQKEEMFAKARSLANLTYNVTARSCSRILIGKTYWNNVALLSILYGINILDINETE